MNPSRLSSWSVRQPFVVLLSIFVQPSSRSPLNTAGHLFGHCGQKVDKFIRALLCILLYKFVNKNLSPFTLAGFVPTTHCSMNIHVVSSVADGDDTTLQPFYFFRTLFLKTELVRVCSGGVVTVVKALASKTKGPWVRVPPWCKALGLVTLQCCCLET
jgi:hypothetical protein